jgi:hypothetical protein
LISSVGARAKKKTWKNDFVQSVQVSLKVFKITKLFLACTGARPERARDAFQAFAGYWKPEIETWIGG